LNGQFVALVGTTKATQGGLRLAVDIARELVRKGYGVVSGLATGIDSAAHLGALKEQGVTMAVLGCGIREIYPEENKPLADLVAGSGLLISEHQPLRKVSKSALVLRNRLISALSRAVVVVQVGAETQGELRTAGYAAQQARPLFYGDPEKDLDYDRFKEWPGVIIDSADSVDEIINYMV
jgi:DNA processing protein